MKRSKIIISSLLVTLMSVTLLGGATYSLFTSESTTDISVSSARVDVVSTVHDNKLDLYSMNEYLGAGVTTFTNGGTATLEENGKDITLERITPGDEVRFKISIQNNSSVKIKYRVKITTSNNDYGTNIVLNGLNTTWTTLAPTTEPVLSDELSILFKDSANDDYQGKSTVVSILVEACQANDPNSLNTIRFVMTPSTQIIEPLRGNEGATFPFPVVEELEYHEFKGWKLEDGTSYKGEGGNIVMPNKDMTLYAVFKPINKNLQVNITYGKYNDFNKLNYQQAINYPINKQELFNKVDAKLSEGLDLEGLYLDSSFTQPLPQNYIMPTNDFVIYAKCKLEPGYHQIQVKTTDDNLYRTIYLPESLDLTKVNPAYQITENFKHYTFFTGFFTDKELTNHFEPANLMEDAVVYTEIFENEYYLEFSYNHWKSPIEHGLNFYPMGTLTFDSLTFPWGPEEEKFGTFKVPDYFYNLKVTQIESIDLSNNFDAIVLPKFINSMGEIGCKKIIVPGGKEIINQDLFRFNTPSPSYDLEFSEGVKVFEDEAFIEHKANKIVFPDSVTTIGKYVLRDKLDQGTIDIYLGKGIQTIGEYALCNCFKNKNCTINLYFKKCPETIKDVKRKDSLLGAGNTLNVYAPKSELEGETGLKNKIIVNGATLNFIDTDLHPVTNWPTCPNY